MTSETDLDSSDTLPTQNKRSIAMVLLVQALNAFNDNAVKILLISLAGAVAKGTAIGDGMQEWLPIVFSLPFVMFAPVAGWLSDRYSKKQVIVWMQVFQLACFAAQAASLLMRDASLSLWLALLGFFLISVQATFFSPAKMGIMKEIAGTRRLGPMSGLLQMTNLACVLLGFFLGGVLFDKVNAAVGDAWTSTLWLLGGVALVGIVQLLCSTLIQPTPSHDLPFQRSLLWAHFGQMKLVFKDRPVRLAGLGISFFWMIANAVGILLTPISKLMGGGATEIGMMSGLLGIGVILGSVIAGQLCKGRVQLGLIFWGGLTMATGVGMIALCTLGSTAMYVGLVTAGLGGGVFMVPLYAYVQGRAVPEERARVLAGINLMDCLGTMIVAGLITGMRVLEIAPRTQLLGFGSAMLGVALGALKAMPREALATLVLSTVRAVYRIRVLNDQAMPATGGLLLLPNHVTYMDALIISAASPRPVRFVIWDSFYQIKWLRPVLAMFDTVPISSARAKDAVRVVAEALKQGEVVCLFPEGQLTRTGTLSEVRRGFELMVRAAKTPVQVVYQDGLWGSIFSHQGAGVLKKLPKQVRYPVTVAFGNVMPPEQANAAAVRETLYQLGSDTFLKREPKADIARMNEVRLKEVVEHDAAGRFYDAASGAVIAVQLPDPLMPAGEEGLQLGTRAGTRGKLLPGIAARETGEGLLLSGLAPNDSRTVTLAGAKLDEMGFVH